MGYLGTELILTIPLYEPSIETKEFNGIAVVSELTEFKNRASIILANRVDDSLLDVKEKVLL